MKIVFDRNAGELLDLFWSLYYMTNYDYVQSEVQKLGVELDANIEQEFLELTKTVDIDRERIEVFFSKETRISEALVHMDEVFDTALEDILKGISNLPKEDVLKRLIMELTVGRIESEVERGKEAARVIAQGGVIDFIKGLEISSSAKWHLFCFVDDTEGQIKEFVDIIRQYAPIYHTAVKKHQAVMEKFNNTLDKKIKEDHAAFLKDITRGNYNPENYETVLFSTTYYYAYHLAFKTVGRMGYLIAGVDFEKVIRSLEGQNETENILAVFKNLSDKTRFEIIKLLLRRDYFGQELADELKITSATVSYHMNFLLTARLIHVERKEHKAYYTLNKETLRACIEFLNREFRL